jgi:hypothetical protein
LQEATLEGPTPSIGLFRKINFFKENYCAIQEEERAQEIIFFLKNN